MIELITSDEIEILVVPTVLEEIRRGSHKDDALTERFIGRFCTQCELTEQEQLWADDLYDEYNVRIGISPRIDDRNIITDHIKYLS